MPSYNSERFISESISSVINQTYTDWELIVVDDGSIDNSVDAIKSFNDNRIKLLVNDKNRGIAYSRNRALREAKGKYIAFLDSDDIWLPTKLESQINFMINNNYKFSYSKYEKIDEEGRPIGKICTGPKVVTKRKMFHFCYPGCLTVMYDRELCSDLQIYEIKINTDYAIWLILCKKANCYLFEHVLAKYRVRAGSASSLKNFIKIKYHYLLYRRCCNKSRLIAFYYMCINIWYGFWKKIIFEKKVRKKYE